jgi:hypothetical protein
MDIDFSPSRLAVLKSDDVEHRKDDRVPVRRRPASSAATPAPDLLMMGEGSSSPFPARFRLAASPFRR